MTRWQIEGIRRFDHWHERFNSQRLLRWRARYGDTSWTLFETWEEARDWCAGGYCR